MPYTIVLTPPETQVVKYVEVSQSLYSRYQPSYLLSADGTSSPHITVIQFEASPALAYEVWESMRGKMREQKFEPFAPLFMGISFIEGAGLYAGTTWVELAVKRGEADSPIMKVHYAALETLKEFNIKPLNAVGNDYRPHLTLARIVMPRQMETCPRSLFENHEYFRLEFGLSDEKWQYAESLDVFTQQTAMQPLPEKMF